MFVGRDVTREVIIRAVAARGVTSRVSIGQHGTIDLVNKVWNPGKDRGRKGTLDSRDADKLWNSNGTVVSTRVGGEGGVASVRGVTKEAEVTEW
jgi:hypothetical protein